MLAKRNEGTRNLFFVFFHFFFLSKVFLSFVLSSLLPSSFFSSSLKPFFPYFCVSALNFCPGFFSVFKLYSFLSPVFIIPYGMCVRACVRACLCVTEFENLKTFHSYALGLMRGRSEIDHRRYYC